MTRKTPSNASPTPALAYLRTSSATNTDGDSSARQIAAIRAYAERAGREIIAEYYDAAVSGGDPIDQRDGFARMLAHAREAGVTEIIVETASRFARSLMVQELGLLRLKASGITLIAADSPDAFVPSGDPMVEAVRQMLGVMAQLDRALTVAKLKGARDRLSATTGRRIEGRKPYSETRPELVREAKRLARQNPVTHQSRTLRGIAAELERLGYVTAKGKQFSGAQILRLLGQNVPREAA